MILGQIIFFIALIALIYLISDRKKHRQEFMENIKNKRAYSHKYDIPRKTYLVTRFDNITQSRSDGTLCYLWIERNALNLIPHETSAKAGDIQQIEISEINYFVQEGDFDQNTLTCSSGCSTGGVLMGDLISGGAEVVSGLSKVGTHKMENKKVDQRTILEYKTMQKPNNLMFLNSKAYKVLMKEIPEKVKS